MRYTKLIPEIQALVDNSVPQTYNVLIKQKFPKVHAYLIEAFDCSFLQSLYRYLHNNKVEDTCKVPSCRNKTKFLDLKSGFTKCCSQKCAGKHRAQLKYFDSTVLKPTLSVKDRKIILLKVGLQTSTFKQWMFQNYPDVLKYCVTESISQGLTYAHILYKILNPEVSTLCQNCGENETPFITLRIGYKKFCCNSCMGSSTEIIEKKKATCNKNLGVDFPQQSKKVQAKLKRQNFEKYGHTNVSQVKAFQKNRERTMLERYGSKNAMGNAGLRSLSASRSASSKGTYKEFKLGNRIVKVLGFEPQALNWIFKNTRIKPSQVKVDSEGIPYFSYKKYGLRTYYPDLYIQNKNLIIEVKSVWSLTSSRKTLQLIKAKANAVLSEGYNFELMLMTAKGSRIDLPLDWTGYTLSQLKRYIQAQA